MKKALLVGLITGVIIIGMVGAANATPITFTDTTTFSSTGSNESSDLLGYAGKSVNTLEYFGDYVSWKHQFTFTPPAQQNSVSGRLTLTISDDETDQNGIFKAYTKEFAFGYAESGDWSLGEVNTGSYTYNLGASSFLEDGTFKITLFDLGGDFSIVSSALEISYEPANAPVPEPSTMVLLGFGVFGLAVYGKRRMNKEA